ncbi:hypothetical protein PDIG_42160 [Penicillium digitatum PHI26]|uniref:Uncharacterized protein n=2 Tax=Penicillium digitatum TaxID=36651 RepID=K9FT17_PEND2|nr:hypothetical protein PDIP_40780 [Penicillium digitatum Pd1]EKV12780.1 hypothetical protein PDIG_42160 [Penicillium digitatum PHI26]EKV15318.1 hypothetical protein PDIP_40780 [Penicillium digitatum Pd1]
MYIGEWIKGWQLVYCFQTTFRIVSIDILCIGAFIVGVVFIGLFFIGIVFIRIFLIGIVFIGSFSIYRNSIIGFDL